MRTSFAMIAFTALCAIGCTKKTNSDVASVNAPAEPRVVNLYIWSDYTSREVLDDFEKKTGIKVQESNYSSNEELLAKLQAGATGFDIAVPSDYMVSVMTKLALLEPLDRTQIPNAAHLNPEFLGKSYDPTNAVSLPYGWSITGIAVNRRLYKEAVTSWSDILGDTKAKGRIGLLDDVREVLGAALKLDGASLNTTDPASLAKAKTRLIAAKPGIKSFTSTPADLLISGELLVAQMYSGEALVASRDNQNSIEFVIPKEGGTLAIDNMVLLKGAPHAAEAHLLMNHLLEAKAQTKFVEQTLFGPVVQGVKDLLPTALQSNTTLFPSRETLARCEMMTDLGDATSAYDRIWSELKAASH